MQLGRSETEGRFGSNWASILFRPSLSIVTSSDFTLIEPVFGSNSGRVLEMIPVVPGGDEFEPMEERTRDTNSRTVFGPGPVGPASARVQIPLPFLDLIP